MLTRYKICPAYSYGKYVVKEKRWLFWRTVYEIIEHPFGGKPYYFDLEFYSRAEAKDWIEKQWDGERKTIERIRRFEKWFMSEKCEEYVGEGE
jgi:hypothetical protein